jgi:predicted dehydrogenase
MRDESVSKTNSGGLSRRGFMKASGAAMAAAVITGRRAFAADNSETLRVGLIGCGGRGTGAAGQALRADPNTKLVALGDVFRDRVEEARATLAKWDVGSRVDVDEDHLFTDFDNYRKVIDACDVVVMGAPPAFRPEHLAYAVEKGCHVFAEKPVAVDPAGVRSVLESCRRAREKRLSIVSGLCYRYEFAKQATIARLRDGAVGDFTAMETVYNTGGLWHKGNNPDWSEMEYQIRNWIYWCWLSGDHINEQHIHSLDKIAWAMGDEYPAKCVASGGRVQRTDPKYGNVYDHFNTTYEWANGVKCFSSCRQWENATTAVYDNIYGTKGTAYIQEHRIKGETGEWVHEPTGPDDMYQNEHNALFAAIRNGDPIVDEYMCHSTLMAIMARMSAYTGKAISWEEAMQSDLDLMPETLAWGSAPNDPVPVPGRRARGRA